MVATIVNQQYRIPTCHALQLTGDYDHAFAGSNKKVPKHLFFRYMARPERFELPTTKFVAWYSIQLSYGREEPRIIPRRGFFVKQKRITPRSGGQSCRFVEPAGSSTPPSPEKQMAPDGAICLSAEREGCCSAHPCACPAGSSAAQIGNPADLSNRRVRPHRLLQKNKWP